MFTSLLVSLCLQDAAALESIVVHDAAFEAYKAMQQIEAAGVDLAKVHHITSGVAQTRLSALLEEAAGLAGITLPAAEQVCKLELF